jgi:signal transduction histidine kinase
MTDLAADIAAIERIDAVPLMLDVITRATGMGFAAVARVTEDRWVALSVKDNISFGLGVGGELPVASTICDEIRQSGKGVVFDNADEHPIFCSHHTPELYGLKSYISLPIFLKDGSVWGTLCAVDPTPHKVDNPETIGMFKLFAELIGLHLTNRERMAGIEHALADAREAAKLREQFVAVLGHDLRNPLGAITSGAELLKGRTKDDRGERIVVMIQQSALRMAEMINNLLDLARSRLGDGVSLKLERRTDLDGALLHAVNEVRSAWPDRQVETRFSLGQPVAVDVPRICQMVSNLVGNAFTHGDPAAPVRVIASSGDDIFSVVVANGGRPIPPEVMDKLFRPFTRNEVKVGQEGLGLGLYIASEIAKAHGGALTVHSTDAETVFRFRMAI